MHTIDVLHYGHLTVMHALDQLPNADWLTPNVCGVWSVKEIIAHLSSFELALADVWRVAQGEPTAGLLADLLRDGQAFNDAQVPARAGLSPADTRAEYEAAHQAAMQGAAGLPPRLLQADRLFAGVWRRVRSGGFPRLYLLWPQAGT